MNFTPMDTNDCAGKSSEDDSRRLMAEYSISHDGRHYQFAEYRYERLADAVAYARLVGAPRAAGSDSPSLMKVDAVEAPSAADRQLMLELSISFEHGSFVFAGFHYDRLVDAANYARHRQQLGLTPR
jgi:hypothetical protein